MTSRRRSDGASGPTSRLTASTSAPSGARNHGSPKSVSPVPHLAMSSSASTLSDSPVVLAVRTRDPWGKRKGRDPSGLRVPETGQYLLHKELEIRPADRRIETRDQGRETIVVSLLLAFLRERDALVGRDDAVDADGLQRLERVDVLER